ncbi:MAG: flagellin [Acidimicrobiia bacterium]|nr:flagellin [Acidimicrobiia bacterium]
MRVNNNIMAFNAARNLGVSNTSLGKSLEKLSSGYRINRAGDDAAGLVISQKLRAEVSGLRQATRNAQDGISFAQTAEGALGEVHSMLNRMRDLAVQAANDTNDTSARDALQSELDALADEIGRIGNDTTFSGATVFSATALNFQVGSEGVGNQLQVTVGALDNTDIGGSDLTSLAVDTAANARTTIEAIDDAIAAVSENRGSLGAAQNRFESIVNNLQVTTENLAASESRIRDTDMAAEMVSFTKSQILQQAGTAMLGQANSIPQSILRLLQQ